MAEPRYHLIATGIIFILVQLFRVLFGITINKRTMIEDIIPLGIFGVLIPDIDHINGREWVKKFMRGEKIISPREWKYRLHTFKGLTSVIVTSVIAWLYLPIPLSTLSYYLPILTFMIHIMIDSANDLYDEPWRRDIAYLPWLMHKYKIFPKCIRYGY